MNKGRIAIVLNAHLPFVRQPDYVKFLEERWLFEAMSETYLPFLRMLRKLEADSVPFKLSIVMSPTLAAMLDDQLLAERFVAYLSTQKDLASKELERTKNQVEFRKIVEDYSRLYERNLEDYEVLYHRNILGVLDYHSKRGKIELLSSAATQAFMPIHVEYPETVGAQIETAIVSHRRHFGIRPNGFWCPHLGYSPDIGAALSSYGIDYTIVTAHGAMLGDVTPKYGSFAPVKTRDGLTVFIRDEETKEAVWSERDGYPADPVYRDFYRDIGYDLPVSYIGPYIEEGGIRIFTGFKYWAITGKTDQKKPYDRIAALEKARDHAENFIYKAEMRLEKAGAHMDIPPLLVCPYDMELFGHWWYEGLDWLEILFRTGAAQASSDFVTLSEYFREFPAETVSEPEYSSWGDGGFGASWIDGSNDWIYRHIFKTVERMIELAERFPNEAGLRERMLNQAARETLLCQCSDWAFLMKTGKSSSFARKQIEDAVSNVDRIYDMLSSNALGTEWITKLEKRNNLFPDINYRMFHKKR